MYTTFNEGDIVFNFINWFYPTKYLYTLQQRYAESREYRHYNESKINDIFNYNTIY